MNDNQIADYDGEDEFDDRSSRRFEAIHCGCLPLDALAADLGTPDEWLIAAIQHLKVQECEAMRRGVTTMEVSTAAVALLMWDWEHRAVNGSAWKGNVQ